MPKTAKRKASGPEYEWREGSRFRVPAQVVGERLDEISHQNDGDLTPKDVVNDARPEEAVLHPLFEWEDPKAAELYREDQARQVIRSVRVIHQTDVGPEPVISRVSVGTQESGPRYVTTARALSDEDMRMQVLGDAMSGLRSWKARYGMLKEMGSIVGEIDRLDGQIG